MIRHPAALCVFFLSVLLPNIVAAQTFEVASLKPSGPHGGNRIEGGPGTSDPLRYTYTSATLEDLIVIAWDIEYSQVASKAPIDRDHFDLTAKIPPGASKQQFRLMLQNLLIDRFRLKSHRERRELSGFALVIAKSGFHPQEQPEGGHFPDLSPGKPGIIANHFSRDGYELVLIRAHQMPASEIARALDVPGDGPVVDQTGLTGKYDFTLEYAYPLSESRSPSETAPAPSVFTAVQQQLGLQLVAKRVPFDVVVIDSFSRVPTEN
jgi:uncharacterized protein (TIGR03435 family)